MLFPAARDERQSHRPLPIPGPQASALHVGGNQQAPITRASIRKGLVAHANLRLAQFAREEARERTQIARQAVPLVTSPVSSVPDTQEKSEDTRATRLAMAEGLTSAPSQMREGNLADIPPAATEARVQRAPSSITGMIPRMPELLPNFSVPSVSTQSVLNGRRQS